MPAVVGDDAFVRLRRLVDDEMDALGVPRRALSNHIPDRLTPYIPAGSGLRPPACGGCPTRCLMPQPSVLRVRVGAGNGTRTRGPLLRKQILRRKNRSAQWRLYP